VKKWMGFGHFETDLNFGLEVETAFKLQNGLQMICLNVNLMESFLLGEACLKKL
jgi:hypothetical protein